MVLDRVRQAGRIGRAEIARGSGLSTQAVSNIISGLLSDGLICEHGRKATARGKPPLQYGLNPSGGFAVGIEIRPDTIFVAVLDLSGVRIASLRQELNACDLHGVTAAVQEAVSAIIGHACVPEAKLIGAGLVMPGPLGRTGLSGTGSEFSIFHDVEPAPWFTDALCLPVVVENDANAGAVAERVSGVAQGLDTFAFLYFGSGLGLGLMEHGRLITGAYGNAGEIGHIPVPSNKGVVRLEDAISRISVQRHLRASGVECENIELLAEAFEHQIPELMTWLEAASAPLSHAVAVIENMFDPQTVIIGGAMPDAILEHLIGSVTLSDRSVSKRPGREVSRVMRGASGRHTGATGAASLAINTAFTPRISAALG